MGKIIVIGGGAAGMMAAFAAAKNGHHIVLLEKNEKLGKKLYITGKGRCNLTNASDMETIMNMVVSNPRFLYSAFYSFTNEDVMHLIEEYGCQVKVERGNRVFPESDKSSDVIRSMQRALNAQNVEIKLHHNVSSLIVEEGICKGVIVNKKELRADAVIAATGGFSYQSTGSTGDGYRFAKEAGHKITDLYPALVPFTVQESWPMELQGLSLRNTGMKIKNGKKVIYEDFGELLFTHFGISGPLVLTASSYVGKQLKKQKTLELVLDLKPALSEEQLDQRLLRDFEASKNKCFKNALSGLYPQRLMDMIIRLSRISPEKPVHEITREDRQNIIRLTKQLTMTINGTRDYNEAIITQGGISVKEVNPSTMESKLVPGLYFCGEVLDLDAQTGGYNLQIAWSTGYLAGVSALSD